MRSRIELRIVLPHKLHLLFIWVDMQILVVEEEFLLFAFGVGNSRELH
jgi:hypothetical protein